jgi:hypothetical protein
MGGPEPRLPSADLTGFDEPEQLGSFESFAHVDPALDEYDFPGTSGPAMCDPRDLAWA